MNKVFKIQIIQPKFNELYQKYEYMFISDQKKEAGAVAIKAEKLDGAKIEDNMSVGGGLLEAKEIKNSSIRRNRTMPAEPRGGQLYIENIEKAEIIGRDKIEQNGDKNKVQTGDKKNTDSKKWFSMQNPIIWLIFSLFLFFVVNYFFPELFSALFKK
jgi:hypothetical protein